MTPSMQKIKVNELFGPAGYWTYTMSGDEGSLTPSFNERWGVTQGEGRFVGVRSVFLRTFGCNLTCPSFGLHHGEKTTEPDEIGKRVHLYKSTSELPGAEFGCDSYYSWHPSFKHLSPFVNVQELAAQILKCTGGTFFNPTQSPIHLVITGGEPLLGWQRAYVDLIAEIRKQDPIWSVKNWLKLPVTFETNGTQPLLADKKTNIRFIDAMSASCDITWSVSAKLTASGHSNEEAIFPDIVATYREVGRSSMYLKFVVQSVDDFDEVDEVVKQFTAAGVDVPVYIMPEGGSPAEFRKHSTLELVGEAVRRGYDITPRLHVMIGDNAMSW